MVDCRKRQKEIYKGTEQNRCINKEAELHLEIVSDEQCAACPVRVMMDQAKVACQAKEMLQRERDKREAKANQLLVINPQDGDYAHCPFRYEHKSRNQYCSITGLEVTPEICGRCDEDTRQHEAQFGEKVKNYFGAVRRWVAMGRPTRSQEEINELFENHCKGCERYDTEKHACKNCGCAVSTDSHPLANKLAMRSEHCPLGRF